jgi:hypothetical protein
MTAYSFPLYNFTSYHSFYLSILVKRGHPLQYSRTRPDLSRWADTQRHTKLQATILNKLEGGKGKESKCQTFLSPQSFPVHQQLCCNHFDRNAGHKIWPMTPISLYAPNKLCFSWFLESLPCWSWLMWNTANDMAIIFHVKKPRTHLQFSHIVGE